ncbi:MAG: metalloregulator ArsR/SmtB family transcription factor [Candidatus Omnitrophota bacterium]
MKKKKSYEYPFEEAAGMLKVVAHPVKLFIISLLEGKSMNVGDIQSSAGAKQPVISQHLNAMASKGILGRERKGNEVFYYIRKKDVLKILTCIKGCCEK